MTRLSFVSVLLAPWLFVLAVQGATIDVPGDYATVQEAIDAADPGDTIQVAAGKYVLDATIDFGGKAITVRGDVNDPAQVVLRWGTARGFVVDVARVALPAPRRLPRGGLGARTRLVERPRPVIRRS